MRIYYINIKHHPYIYKLLFLLINIIGSIKIHVRVAHGEHKRSHIPAQLQGAANPVRHEVTQAWASYSVLRVVTYCYYYTYSY